MDRRLLRSLPGWLAGLLVWAYAGCSRENPLPNVLLLTLDTLRADALGCYGNPEVKTPFLDQLAQEGVLFEDAVCQVPATLASHAAILTGRYPKTTGVRFRTSAIPPSEITLAEVFREQGYDTVAFISSLVLEPAFGTGQGFDRFSMGSMFSNSKPAASERRAEETISEVITYLDQLHEKPFFLWIHLYDPHSPYHAPAPYTAMVDPNYEGDLEGSVQEITRLTATHGTDLNEKDLAHLRALYHGEVTYMDAQIGRLLDALRRNETMENTILAVLSDHGEALGEKGHFFHGQELYEHSVHIPFLLRYPRQVREGLKVPESVQSIDLFPTLLQLAGVESAAVPDGHSLLPLIQKDWFQESLSEPHPAFLETEADVVCESNKLYALRTDPYKFIFNAAHRRPETPLGVFTEIPLKGPTLVMMRVKGDPSVRLLVHVRYRTRDLYTSRDLEALARLNTTTIMAESVGADPLQREAMAQESFLPTPEGWQLQITPDLFRVALEYGESLGWPTAWMVIEGVGVDASLPYNQKNGRFLVDQFELYAPSLRFPDSPRYRKPYWVIEDFEGTPPRELGDPQQGPPHEVKSAWFNEPLFGGNRQQQVEITFLDDQDPAGVDELYDLNADAAESKNLLASPSLSEEEKALADKIASNCRLVLTDWLANQGQQLQPLEMDAKLREALGSLGYVH